MHLSATVYLVKINPEISIMEIVRKGSFRIHHLHLNLVETIAITRASIGFHMDMDKYGQCGRFIIE